MQIPRCHVALFDRRAHVSRPACDHHLARDRLAPAAAAGSHSNPAKLAARPGDRRSHHAAGGGPPRASGPSRCGGACVAEQHSNPGPAPLQAPLTHQPAPAAGSRTARSQGRSAVLVQAVVSARRRRRPRSGADSRRQQAARTACCHGAPLAPPSAHACAAHAPRLLVSPCRWARTSSRPVWRACASRGATSATLGSALWRRAPMATTSCSCRCDVMQAVQSSAGACA